MVVPASKRLAEAAASAKRAAANGDRWGESEAWRRYRLIEDAQRPAEDLLAAGIALSKVAVELSEQR